MTTAGASADREYQRRRAREVASRRPLPVVLAIMAVVGIGAYFLAQAGVAIVNSTTARGATAVAASAPAPKAPITPALGHLLGLLLAGVAIAQIAQGTWGRRQSTEAWAQGAAGERRTARLLTKLEGHGYVALHDRLMPGGRSNIDHVVVGPTGVWVIETKAWSGKVQIGRQGLRYRGRPADQYIVETAREAEVVRRVTPASAGGSFVPVHALLCIHGATFELSWFSKSVFGAVRVCSGRRLVKIIRSGKPVLGPSAIQEVASEVRARLPPAVG